MMIWLQTTNIPKIEHNKQVNLLHDYKLQEYIQLIVFMHCNLILSVK